MTTDNIKTTVDDLVNSRGWNYFLMISAIFTFAIAIRNVYVYSKKIAEEESAI